MIRQLYGSHFKKNVIGLLIISICLFTAATSQAVSLEWNPAGGPAGTWDSVTANWSGTFPTWQYGYDAVFGSGVSNGPFLTGGAVTVDSNGVVVQSMTFNLGGYILQTGPITLTGTPVITVTNASDTATINSIISGFDNSIGMTKSGAGTLTLGGTNTYAGDTTVNNGTLKITNVASLSTGSVAVNNSSTLLLNANIATATYLNAFTSNGTSSTINVIAGTADVIFGNGTLGNWSGFTGTLDLNPSTGNTGKTRFTTTQANLISSSAIIKVESGTTLYLNQGLNYGASVRLYGAANSENLGALRLESGANQSGSVTLYGNSSIGANSSGAMVSGNIGESGGPFKLEKRGNNTLLLLGTNNYSGGTTVSTGTLLIGNGGTSGNLGGGAITSSGTPTLAFNRGDAITVSNNIGGPVTVQQLGSGTTTLTNATNAYTGLTTVRAGTLRIGDGTSGVKGTGAITFDGNGTISFNEVAGSTQNNGALTFGTTTAGVVSEATVQSTYGGSGNTTLNFTAGITRNVGATGNFVISGGANGTTNSINFTTLGAGFINQGLFFGGSDYAYLNASGTYVRAINYGTDANSENITTGPTTFTAGNLFEQISGSGQITGQTTQAITTMKFANSNSFTIAPANTLSVNGILLTGGNNVTISGGSIQPVLTGNELVIRTDTSSDSLAISTPFLQNGATANALTKCGPGTLTLSGANTYIGTTSITGGVVNFSGTLGISPATAAGLITVSGANARLNILPGANIRLNNANMLLGNASNSTGYVYQSGGTVTGINQLQLGAANFGSYGYYNLSGGAITVTEADVAGFNGASVGVLDIANGTMTISSWLVPSRGTGSTGIVNMTGGNLVYNGPAGQFSANWNDTSQYDPNIQGATVFNIANASLTALAADVNLMQTGAVGKLGEINLLTGGVFQAHSIAPGSATGTSLVNFNGGTLKASTLNSTFLSSANLTGVYVYGNGGTIDNNGVAIGIDKPLLAPTGSGVSNSIGITNGGSGYTGAPAVRISGNGVGAAGYATINIGGQVTGIVITNPGTGYTGTPTISLLGGGGYGATTSALTLAANTSGGGMTFTGSGAGITTLTSSTSTYTGATTVSGGTLLLSSTGGAINNSSGININGSGAKLVQNSATNISTPVTVTNGTLDGTQTVNSVVVNDGPNGFIANGNGTTNPFYIGSLTFNGAGTISLNTASTLSVLNVTTLNTGSVNAAGKVTISASNTTWNPGVYDLINYNTLGGVGFTAFTKGTITGLGNRQSATLTNLPSYIALTVAGDNPVWTGAILSGNPGYGNWTTATLASPKNWKLITSSTPTDYISGDAVLFDDTAYSSGGTTNVNISSADVSPTSVTFNNNSAPYTINGPFGIIGSAGLLMNGYNTVTLNASSTYSGGTTLNAGTLNINNASAIGTGALNIAASTTIDNTSGSPVSLTTVNAQNWNGDFAFGGTNDLNLGTGAVPLTATRTVTVNSPSSLPGTGTLTVGGAISGGFGITKDGLGKLVLTGANTYSGNTTVSAGILTVGPGGSINSSAISDSYVSVASGAAFYMNGGNVTLGNNIFSSANNNNIRMVADDSVINIASGTLTCSVGAAGTSWNQIRGTFRQTGGSLVTQGFSMSDANSTTTNYYLGGTGTMSVGQGEWASLPVGARGVANFYVSGSAALTVTGATNPANNNANQLDVGAVFGNADVGNHLFVQQGGTVTTNGLVVGSFSVTGSASAPGVYFLNGGTLTTSTLTKGAGSTGTLNFGGGTLRTGAAFSTDAALTTNINSGGATIDTSGGDLTWSGVLAAGTTGSAGFTGLTNTTGVYSYVPWVTFSSPPSGTNATGIAILNQAGQVFDIVVTDPGSGYTSAPTITIDPPFFPGSGNAATATGTVIASPGGLTKTGVGTLTLANTNTYTGPTTVNAGKLLLNGAGSINTSSGITINGSTAKFVQSSSVPVSQPMTVTTGTLDGTTTVNSVVVSAGTGGIVANGDGSTSPLTIGSLTFNGAGALNLNTAGAVSLNTTTLTTGAAAHSITVNATNTSWTSGTVYDLVSYSTLSGLGFTAFQTGTIMGLTPRQGATLTNPAGFIALSITGGNIPVWSGAVNGNWTTAVIPEPKNWKLQTGGATTDFLTGDSVLFDDTATNTTAVSISDADVNPTLITFNNTTTPGTGKIYTISSAGGFGIVNGSLVKNGNGSVTISTNNSYTGGTTVNNGTLILSGNNNFGTGGVTVIGGIALLSGTNTYSGATTVSGGTLVLSTADTIGTGSVTVNGGTLDLGGSSQTFSSLQGTGGTITNNVGASILTVTSGAYSGNINNGIGTVALVKTTTGIQTLSGSSSNFSGGTTISAGALAVGSNHALGTGLVTMNSGTLAASTTGVNVPNNIQADVSSTFNATNDFTITGNITDNVGSQTITGAGTLTLAGTNSFLLTNAYAGVYVQGGSTLSITGSTTISGTGTINGYMTVGSNTAGNGTVTVLPGGTLTINGNTASSPNTIFGQQASTGVLDVNGGNVIVGPGTGIIFGNADAVATGALNINSGTITVNSNAVAGSDGSSIMLGRENATASGSINLNGGTLATDREIVRNGSSGGAAGVANFNFNGGTLKALADQTDWLRSNVTFSTANVNQLELTAVTLQSGGAIIDSNGFNVAINNVLAHDASLGGIADGGLKKTGAGTLTITGVNTYTGGTTINGGTLSIGSDAVLGATTGKVTLNKTGLPAAVLQTTASLALANDRPLEVGAGGGAIDVLGSANTLTVTPLAATPVSISGPLTVQGGGVFTLDMASTPTLTSSAALTIAGSTTMNAGGTADPFSSGSIHMAVANDGILNITAGSKHVGALSGTGHTSLAASTQLTAMSIVQNTVTLGVGARITIAPISGGPTAGTGSLTAVPEPSTWAMLMLAAMGLGMYWRRRSL